MWSKKEEKYLRKNYSKESAEMIAKSLDKTRNSIYQKASSMGLNSGRSGLGDRWSSSEIEKLEKLFPTTENSELVDIIGRTESSIKNKADDLGISKKKKLCENEKIESRELFKEGLSVEEISEKMNLSSSLVFNFLCNEKRLKIMYKEQGLSQKEIGERFSRNQSVISEKMSEFGIDTCRSEPWSEKEEKFLRENYLEMSKEDLVSELSKRTWNAIKSKALELGLARDASEYKNSEEVKDRLRSLSESRTIKVNFEKTDLVSYVLGVVDGDGYHDGRYTIGLEVNSKKFADKFQGSLEGLGLNPGRGKREDRGKEKVWASSVKFIEWYERLDRDEKRDWLLQNGDCWKYIEGRYESDGNIHPSGSPRITSMEKQELEFMFDVLSSLNVECNIQKNNIWVCKEDAEKFFINIDPVIKRNDG